MELVHYKEIIKDLSKYSSFQDPSKAYKITDEIKFHEAGLLKLNCDKALYYLKWLPTLDYNKLIEFTGSWYSKFHNQGDDMYDFTLSQIDNYENIATNKKIDWAK